MKMVVVGLRKLPPETLGGLSTLEVELEAVAATERKASLTHYVAMLPSAVEVYAMDSEHELEMTPL